MNRARTPLTATAATRQLPPSMTASAAASSTARTPPPAITPVPGAAGFNNTCDPLNRYVLEGDNSRYAGRLSQAGGRHQRAQMSMLAQTFGYSSDAGPGSRSRGGVLSAWRCVGLAPPWPRCATGSRTRAVTT